MGPCGGCMEFGRRDAVARCISILASETAKCGLLDRCPTATQDQRYVRGRAKLAFARRSPPPNGSLNLTIAANVRGPVSIPACLHSRACIGFVAFRGARKVTQRR